MDNDLAQLARREAKWSRVNMFSCFLCDLFLLVVVVVVTCVPRFCLFSNPFFQISSPVFGVRGAGVLRCLCF